MSVQQLILIRGLPGSGKTTAARKIAAFDPNNRVILEGDQYFEVQVPGFNQHRYYFDATKLKQAHERCRYLTEECLAEGLTVIVSNTFTTMGEMTPYIHMSTDLDVPLMVIKCTGDYGSVHGVPAEVMERMAARWEDYDVEVSLEECHV